MLQEGYMMSPSGFSDTSILEILHTISFPATNGWQDWVTFSDFPKIYLESGERKIRLMFRKIPFNLNWILFEEFDVPILGLELDNIRINVYPNPTTGMIVVELDGVINEQKLKIYDVNGKQVLSKLVDKNIVEIDLSMMEDGTYIIQWDNGKHVLKKQLIIQH